MALTDIEKRQAKEYKEKGYSNSEIMGFIAGQRLKRTSSIAAKELQERRSSEQSSVLNRVARDIPQDFMQMGENIGNNIREGGEDIVDIATGDGTIPEKVLDIGSEAFKRGGRVVSEPYLFAIKAPFTQEFESSVANKAGELGQAAAETYPVQSLVSAYKNASPEVQKAVTRSLGFAEGAAEIFGLGKFTKGLRQGVEKTIQNIPEIKYRAPEFDFPKFNGTIPDVIQRARVSISDVPPQVETILKNQQNADKVNAYFDQAEKAATNPAERMPTQIAADQGILAYNTLDEAKNSIGKAKYEALNAVADVKLSDNIPGNAIDSVRNLVKERFGADFDTAGNIIEVPGRTLKLDDPSKKLLSNYVSMLRQLGPNPSAQKLDDFIDKVQSMLYKQSSPNLFDIADEPLIALLKQQTGEINSSLKRSVNSALKERGIDADYAKLNEEWSSLNDVTERLNKRLGIEGDKGASLMKSLFSPQTGEPTRRLFQEIKDLTGIDLFEEATLAKFAMESVGDPRSKSLLQSLGEQIDKVGDLSLTEPMSWINFIRENSDLDGRELANAIIEQAQKVK